MPHPDEGTIHAWLDGELSVDEGAALEEHLGTCDECVAHVAEARGLIAGSSRIMGILDDVPGSVIPSTTRKSGLTSLGEMLTAKTGEGPSIELLPPEAVPAPAARRPWWMSNQIRAAAAVVLVVGGVFLSWGRLNKGEVSLKDSANATPEFLATQMDSLPMSAPRVTTPPAVVTAGADARAANPAAQTADASIAGPVAGTPGSRTETKVATTPALASADSAPPTRAEESASRERLAKAELSNRAEVGQAFGTATGKAAIRNDTPSVQVQAQSLAQREEERRRLALAARPVAPPAESKKQAVVAERDDARDASASVARAKIAGAAASAPAPTTAAATPASTPVREETLRHPSAGCYTVQPASWSPALSPAELAAIPTSFELDTITATGGPSAGRGLVHPRPESVRSRYEAMFWQPDAGGRATVTMRGAQGSLTLALGGGGTQGIALFSRSGGATSRSLITLSRSACR